MTIFKKIEFHPFFFIISFIVILTGQFKEFFLFTSLIFIHECGHAGMAILWKWNFEKIIIFPFGGVTKFRESLNRPIIQECLILIAGPLSQIIYYVFLCSITDLPPSFSCYHYALLFFNLLPIYPLDGSKLFSLLLEQWFPFKRSYEWMLTLSLHLSIFLFFYYCFHFQLFFIFFFLFLMIKTLEEKKQVPIIYERFLLERFLYDFHFPKLKRIKGEKIDSFYRDCKHLFYLNNLCFSEKDILQKKFDLNRKVW